MERNRTLWTLATVLAVVSAFLLYELVLDEEFADKDTNAWWDAIFMIGGPALAALIIAGFALRRRSRGLR